LSRDGIAREVYKGAQSGVICRAAIHRPDPKGCMSITLLDFVVAGVVLLSALLAMVRGFTREVLSIAAWATAAIATVYFFPDVRDWAREIIEVEPRVIADVIAGAGIFLTVLILVSLITMRISDAILDSRIGPIDRALGFVYGGARGFLLVVIAFLFFAWLVPERSQPVWVQNATTRPLLADAGETLLSMLPSDPEATILRQLKGLPGTEEAEPGTVPDGEPAPNTGAAPAPAQPDAGYRPSERQNMQRLMESTEGAD
jgi:membrane protein required for colicin V production